MADGAEDDRGHRQIEIRRLVDDNGIVAAEFEQAPAEPLRHTNCHLTPDVGRAGERQQRNPAVIDQPRREFCAGVDEKLKNRRYGMPFQDAVANVLHGNRTQRGFRRGLPDDGIAGDRRQKGIPGPYRHREVEGRNYTDNAQRVPLLIHAMLRAFGVHGIAIQHARLADGEVGDVDHLLHFASALRLDLAVFQAHQAAERVFVQAQLLSNEAHDLAALGCRHQPPQARRFHGRRQYALIILCRRAAHLCKTLAGGGID